MNDLIERQDAIEVIEEMQMPIMRSMFPEEQFVFKGMSEALSAIKDLPSAQPEPLVKESRTLVKDLVKDTISRQAAMDALCSDCQGRCIPCESYPCSEVEAINALPSAHQEIQKRKEEFAQNVPKEDLISRKAAIKAIVDCTVYGSSDELEEAVMQGNDWNRWSGGVLEALEAVKELPSSQPEIIRCRDCKYWREHKYAKETKRYIPFCGYNAIYTKSDDFCSKAERRTDGVDN